MKVCPYCQAVNEEKQAIKCEVCGKDIHQEPEYTVDELINTDTKKTLNERHQNLVRQKRLKKFIIGFTVLVSIVLLFFIFSLFRIKGHININQTHYQVVCGEEIVVTPMYSEKLLPKHIRLKIESARYKGTKQSINYYVKDNSYIFKGLLSDDITITFIFNEDNEQVNYNKTIYIKIIPVAGNLNINLTSAQITIGDIYQLKPILSNGLTINDVYYQYEGDNNNGLIIKIVNDYYEITALDIGTYYFHFYLDNPDSQQTLNNQDFILKVK